MADQADQEVEGKGKGSRLKLVLLVVGVIVLVGGAVGATLFFTGFFDKPPEKAVEEILENAEQQAAQEQGAAAPGVRPTPKTPERVSRKSPELTRFEQQYLGLEKAFLANVANSRKVMQVSIAVMTHYDDRVFKNVLKHEFALRSAVLDEMRQVTEPELDAADFRVKLAERLRLRMNEILERKEDFGGIEEVHFTEFIVQ